MPRNEREAEVAIAERAKEMKRADNEAARARTRWEAAVHDGNVNFGVTYDRCAELSKLSRSRIDQVLRKLRIRSNTKESNHASV